MARKQLEAFVQHKAGQREKRTRAPVESVHDRKVHFLVQRRGCHHCGASFEPTATRRLFCATKCELKYRNDHRYVCFYCGDNALSRDHVFPQQFGGGAGDIVIACQECNTTMESSSACSVIGRLSFLIERYEKKYDLHSPAPDWDEDDLADLGPNLRSSIEQQILKRQRAKERVVMITARLGEIVRLSEGE